MTFEMYCYHYLKSHGVEGDYDPSNAIKAVVCSKYATIHLSIFDIAKAFVTHRDMENDGFIIDPLSLCRKSLDEPKPEV